MTEWRSEQLVFVDESAANERTGDRKFGWAPVGAVAEVSEPFKGSEKCSILPMFTVDGYEAWEVIHGSFNMELFNSFIKNHVLPRMNAFPGPRSVLVMDNCRIHRNEVLNHGLELTVDIEGNV